MSREGSDALIAKLVADLEPVEPIRPIWQGVVGLLTVAGLVAAGVFLAAEPWPTVGSNFLRDPVYTGVLAGLALAVVGGWTGALASVVPGRERLLRLGFGIALAGLLLALGVAAGSTPWVSARVEPVTHLLACVGRAAGLAALPALAALGLTARGWSGRPALTAALALVGAGASGAVLVHLTCPVVQPLHALLTHASPPILVVALLTGAVAPFMGRWAR